MGIATAKGKKAPRENVKCANCKRQFNRCVYHPYITMCSDCRKKTKLRKDDDYSCCGEVWKKDKMGTFACRCGREWWLFGRGFYYGYYRLDMDVFYKGKYLGTWEKHGDFKRIINEHKEAV